MQNLVRIMRYGLVIACLIVASFFLTSKAQAGTVWLTLGDPQPTPQTGGIFETELKFSSCDAVMGAYLVTVHYDPAILQILEITTPEQSEFYGKTFADEDSFGSGTTEITAFQVDNASEQDVPATFATIKWEVLSEHGTSATIELETQSMIDSFLRSAEVISYSITFEISEGDMDGDGLPDDLEDTTCTDPNDADTDDDGIDDGVEDANQNGVVDPGETSPCDIDSDDDNIQDGTEAGYTLDDIGPDTDTGVFQPDLNPSTTTDPLDPDTDGDGLLDGEEDTNYNGRLDPGETDPVPAVPVLPVIDPIADDSTVEGTSYTGPTPSLSQGTLPVTWSLVTGPGDMTIEPDTGVVSWSNPTVSGSPHTITIQASNTAGSDTESWQLTVIPPPSCAELADRFDQAILTEGLVYYTDRDYTLTDVPSAYEGLDAILLPNDERNLTDASDYVTFSMPYDGTVYIAFDSRATSRPIWMNDFIETGDRLLTSLSTQPSLIIYSQSYLQGDCINFGANKASGFAGNTVSNYLVFMQMQSTDPPLITDQPDNVTVVEGQTATFTISATGPGELHYQWIMNGSNVGSDSPIFTLPNCQLAESGAQISCEVSNAYGTTPSTSATLTVIPPPSCAELADRFDQAILTEGLVYYTDRDYTLTDVPSAYEGLDAILLPNDERNLTDASDYVTFTMPYDGTVYIAYDSRATSRPIWMNDFIETGDRLLTSLSTQPSLIIYSQSYLQGDCINFGANKASGFAGNTVSNYLVFMQMQSTDPPLITDQPDNVTVVEGQTATFTISATGPGELHYQWIMNGSNVGSDSPIFTLPNCQLAESGAQISCEVSNAYGTTPSTSATLTVNPIPPDTTDPEVTITSPTSNATHSTSSDSMSIGGTASDNVDVTMVSWSNDRGGFGDCSGTDAWSVNGILLYDGDNVITVTAEDAASNSSTDVLTVTYTIPTCAELAARFDQAILTEGLVYYTDRDYTLTDVPAAYQGLDAILLPNDERNLTDASDYVTFTMPYDGMVYIAFDSRATSRPIWMNDFIETGDRLLTSLSTQPSLIIYSQSYLQGDCINFGANKASGFAGNTVSNYLVFMQKQSTDPPLITDQPDNVTVVEGQTATFTISATGPGELHYQWIMNGSNVGSDSPIFTLPNCQLAESGAQISCEVSNAYGTTLSNSATLTVIPPPSCAELADRFDQAILTEGLVYYTDRDYTLTDVPSAYEGLDAILLPNDERNLTDASDYVTFSMPYDGTVYIAFDSRATSRPIWMNDFIETGDRLLTSLSTQPSLIIYSQSYLQGDCINFGANKASGFAGNTVSNYLVFMQMQSTDPPLITDQPDNVTVVEGQTATFTISATGPGELHYQWIMNGSNVGSDSPIFTLPNCQLAESGAQISCEVSNAYGTTPSTSATLTVIPPPSCAELADRFDQAILTEGLVYYTDRDYTLTDVPAAYQGLDAILLPNDERNLTDASDYVTFSMPYDGMVYIAFDSRATSRPIWMNDFIETGDRLLTSLSTQPSLIIYSQSYLQGDCINFGANKASGFAGNTVSNYLVFY